MDPRSEHIHHLRAAEAQFRLATAARLATTLGHQPLDLPLQWSHGRHLVTYSEIAIDPEEADFAAWNLQRSATFLMASQCLEAIRGVVPNPKSHSDRTIVSAYQISRLIRNAFAHCPFAPIWRIDPDCRSSRFEVPDVMQLDCDGLDGKPFDWHHYGGPLALLRLSQFVRRSILGDTAPPEQVIPIPQRVYIQQGDLILQRVDAVPPSAVPVDIARLPDGGLPLPGGHVLRPTQDD